MNKISKALIKGKEAFMMINPSYPNLMKLPWMRSITMIPKVVNLFRKRDSIEDFAANVIGSVIIAPKVTGALLMNRLKSGVLKGHQVASQRPGNWKLNGLGATRRTWVTNLDKNINNERIVKKLVIIYHDANKARKHIDVHLGHLSIIYRVSGKPFENKIRFNSRGALTEESKKILLDHVRDEISRNTRVVWNHDHTVSNAKCSWNYDDSMKDVEGYGAGATRQIIAEDLVEFYHPEVTSSLHFYAPFLNPNQGLYAYQIYPGTEKTAPILIVGNLVPRDEKYQDRLHLKMIQEDNFEKDFLRRVHVPTITRKYDGASCYFNGSGEIEKHHSFKVFSPRMSKETGHRIEYTYKVPEIADRGIAVKTQGMGELLFWERTLVGRITEFLGLKGPEHICWNYLPASGIAGVLNSNSVRPQYILPEIRIYRIDKWNDLNVNNLPFFENRALQEQLVNNLDCEFMKVVALVRPTKNIKWEGLVGVAEGDSINNGFKIKWWANANDWQVTSVDLKLGPKGNIAGVVWFKSLESGKDFKLGPSNLGGVDRQLIFMSNPESMIGHVFKVHSRNGHEGRAAKLLDEHLDKGLA